VIKLQNITIRQGEFLLKNVSVNIPTGSYAVLMGRSGSGKTTILESICGLRRVNSGKIVLAENDVTSFQPGDRGIGFVPQDGALFPTMTVRKNVSFAMDLRNWPQDRIDKRVDELGQWLGITHLLDRRPLKLSGGETQRVALGRALAVSPSTLCLDEPLSALDDQSRREMYGILKTIHGLAGVTTLHITHSRNEARRLADRLYILEDGKLTEKTNRKTQQ
jgi:molybdate/tungstate transport system ATP-binding protein